MSNSYISKIARRLWRLFHYRGLKRDTFLLKKRTKTPTKFEDKINVIFWEIMVHIQACYLQTCFLRYFLIATKSVNKISWTCTWVSWVSITNLELPFPCRILSPVKQSCNEPVCQVRELPKVVCKAVSRQWTSCVTRWFQMK